MASVSDLDVYEIAYLCAGAERVALAAVVARPAARRQATAQDAQDRGSLQRRPARHAPADATGDFGPLVRR